MSRQPSAFAYMFWIGLLWICLGGWMTYYKSKTRPLEPDEMTSTFSERFRRIQVNGGRRMAVPILVAGPVLLVVGAIGLVVEILVR